MKITINPEAMLFRIKWRNNEGYMVSTVCLSNDLNKAIKVTHQEYSDELPENTVLAAYPMKPNDTRDEWRWYEAALKLQRNGLPDTNNKQLKSIIVDVDSLIVTPY